MDIRELYQELIIDHGTHPRNCCSLDHFTTSAEGVNPLCGDKVSVFIELDNEHIVNASFMGEGCAISISSASLMTETIMKKPLHEVLNLIENFKSLLTSDNISTDMGKLNAFANVKLYPARVKCATLAWHTLASAIHKNETPVTTEEGPYE